MTRPFTWYHNFWPCDLDLEVWLTSEKLWSWVVHVLMVAVWRALSSDNSYCLYSSLEPKAWASYCHSMLSVLHPSINFSFLCPRHKMARGHLVFALSVLPSFRHSVLPSFRPSVIPSFRRIKVCLLNSSYILAWIWMKLSRDVAPQV